MVKVIVAGMLLHNAISAGWSTCPSGLTVMVKNSDGPVQLVPPLLNMGVTVTVPVRGDVPAFVAENDISPDPLAGRPIPGSLLVHVYDVVPPVLFVVKDFVPVLPSHKIMSDGGLTCAVGLTVIVNVTGGPGHDNVPL